MERERFPLRVGVSAVRRVNDIQPDHNAPSRVRPTRFYPADFLTPNDAFTKEAQ